jgi:hypothetical protein
MLLKKITKAFRWMCTRKLDSDPKAARANTMAP